MSWGLGRLLAPCSGWANDTGEVIMVMRRRKGREVKVRERQRKKCVGVYQGLPALV